MFMIVMRNQMKMIKTEWNKKMIINYQKIKFNRKKIKLLTCQQSLNKKNQKKLNMEKNKIKKKEVIIKMRKNQMKKRKKVLLMRKIRNQMK